MSIISDNLLAVRNSEKLLQKDVAAQTGITATALSAYEKGQREPTLTMLVRLAKFYGVSIDWLCGIERKPEVKKLEDMTRADVIRGLIALQENVEYSKIRCTDICNAEYGTETYRVAFEIESDSNWCTAFFEKYTALQSLYKSGDIDSEVLEAWKEKKLIEPMYQETINSLFHWPEPNEPDDQPF